MKAKIDELRPMTAGRLLELWQERREKGGDALERSLLCNAKVLAECCYHQGEAVFADEWAVLSGLTAREMETLLRRLSGEKGHQTGTETVNSGFDPARYDALRGE